MVRHFVLRALPLAVLLACGAVLMVVADSKALVATGFMIAAVAAVLLTALFFYEVGLSEDRDRASGCNRRPPRSHSS